VGGGEVPLEESNGESCYRLYHHLSVLEGAGMVTSRVTGKAKEYTLQRPDRPEAIYLELNADDPEEKGKLETLVGVVREVSEDRIPQLDKVTWARLMLSSPWSVEGEG
jgi:hypothetical protein